MSTRRRASGSWSATLAPMRGMTGRAVCAGPIAGGRSAIRSTVLAATLAAGGVAVSGARETNVDYHEALDRLAGAHPKVLVRGLALPRRKAAGFAEFRQRFRRGFPGIVRSYDKLDRGLGEPLMPEPPATKTKTQFVETMDRIRRFCGTMDRFGQSYLVTGKESHGREAARHLLHIASWSVEAGGGFKACDEVPMSIMQLGPRVYDWVYALLTEEERARVRRVFRDRGAAMFKRVGEGKRVPTDSHGGRMLGFVGVAGIASGNSP